LSQDAWSYPPQAGYRDDLDLTGYAVVATDGDVGKVEHAGATDGEHALVVSTGPRLLGKAMLLPLLVPAALVSRIDVDQQRIFVDRPARQIDDSPPYDTYTDETPAYRDEVARHYGLIT
jgi:hypothetical protein